MFAKQVFLIDGKLFYLDNGNYYPFRITSRGGGGIREISLINVTYSQLISLINSNSLNPGLFYRITDFRTRELIPNTSEIITGPIEPLIVQAATVNTIHESVISQSHPADNIFYEVVNTTTSADDMGRIYYRLDTTMNVSAWYNWRVIKFRRWETAPDSGIFTILTDNGGAFIDIYTFNNSAVASNTENTALGEITSAAISLVGAPSDKLNNFTFNSSFIFDNQFANDCFNNTLNADDAIVGNRIKSVFALNVLVSSKLFANNNIGIFCLQNALGDDFSNNNIEQNFIGNQIVDGFINNDIHDNFSNNTIDELCQNNSFGDNCSGNIIGKRFNMNAIQDDFTNNIIADDYNQNQIANEFMDNVNIGNNFNDNIIKNGFSSNSNIAADFQKNYIESGLTGLDFSAAVLVYNDYTKTIFKNSAGNYTLNYVDGANTVQYAAPNA